MKKNFKNNIGIGKVIAYFRKINMSQKRFFIVGLLGILVASLAILAQPIYFSRMIDVMLAYGGGSKLGTIQELIKLLIIIMVLNILR